MRTGVLMAFVRSAVAPLWAQNSGPVLNKKLQETARVLEAAKINGQADASRRALEQSADLGSLERRATQAKRDENQPQPFAEKALTVTEDAKLNSALRNVSPEGKNIIAQSSTAPALRAPDAEAVTARPVVPAQRLPDAEAPVGGAAKAGKKKPAKGQQPAAKGSSNIVITAQGSAYFDTKNSMAVFVDDVVLDHPLFHLTGDELEVYMKKEEDKPKPPIAGVPAANPAPGTAPASGAAAAPVEAQSGDSSIDKAIAKGRKVVIVKADQDGEPQIGICRHCTYDGATGDATLRDHPQVQRGNNVIIATSPSTYMIIKASGELKTFGPNRVDIIQEEKKAPAPANPNAPPAPVLGRPKPQGGQQ